MKTGRINDDDGYYRSNSRNSSRRRRSKFGVPKMISSSSESSSASSSSPDAHIFRGAEILRKELLTPPQASMMTMSMNDTFNDDDWSDPWSVQAGHLETPSPAKYSQRQRLVTPDSNYSLTSNESATRTSLRNSPALADNEFSSSFDESLLDTSLLNYSESLKPEDSSLLQDSLLQDSVSSRDSPPPPPPDHSPPNSEDERDLRSLLTPTSDTTPTTTMGRESSLRFKTVTYLVESHEDEDGLVFDDDEDEHGYVPTKYQPETRRGSRSPSGDFWQHYDSISSDPAYQHAQRAGMLWQTLVGQHVKFPKTWWKGARTPEMGSTEKWLYIARHKVYKNSTFTKLVPHRSASGKLLLHVVVRDLMTFCPLTDVVIGCFHPNARDVRKTDKRDVKLENCRDIWMSIRKRHDKGSIIEPLLTRGRSMDEIAQDSPLGGSKRSVTNTNMKAVFGESPPLKTVFIDESELYERMMAAEEQDSFAAPALVLLQEFS